MKNILSRAIAFITAAIMTAGFSSCAKNDNSGGEAGEQSAKVIGGSASSENGSTESAALSGEIASKEHVYKSQAVNIPDGIDYPDNAVYANGKIFIFGYNTFSEGEGENTRWYMEEKLLTVGLDGTLEKENFLFSTKDSIENSRSIIGTAVTKDGDIICIESGSSHFIVKYSGEDGSKISESSLNGITAAQGGDFFTVESIAADGSGRILFSSGGTIFITNESGDNLGTMSKNSADTYLIGLLQSGDGRVFAEYGVLNMESSSSDIKLAEINAENQTFGEEYPLAESGTVMNGTGGHDLLISKSEGLFGYDVETGEAEMIVNWIKSGIDISEFDTDMRIAFLDDGRIFCVTYGHGQPSYGMKINLLSEIPPEEVPNKSSVKLYTLNLSDDVRRQITEFNKKSIVYEIEMTDFLVGNSDFDSALTKMNTEITTGNIPDVLIIGESFPVDSYISKGLLADMYGFMDSDDSFERGDYLQNIFEAYERDGKLFEAAPLFSISTVAAKTSKVGETQDWTMDEFMNFVNENSSDSSGRGIFDPLASTKGNMLSVFITYNLNSYMDMETGECNFDGEDFIKLLEFCNRFPKESDVSKSDSDYWDEIDNGYRNGNILLGNTQVNNFSAIKTLEQGQFGESVTFKGYPSENGIGSAVSSPFTIAIMSKAANTVGAWEFVKHFYSDKFQDIYSERNSYYFPVKISSLNKQAEAAMKNGSDIPGLENAYYIGDSKIIIDGNTEEDNEKIMDFIKSVNTVKRYDSYVYDIVTEEAEAYFEGQRSAQEAADIIQNRVSNYIAENR